MPNLRSALAAVAGRPPAIPDAPALSFTIGQDAGGCWVALESHGIAGGLFRNRDDALHYAGGEIRNGRGEIRFATGPIAFKAGC
ncbi:RAG2 PHD domain containing protein [Methylobacterium sp. E-041]|jgi:hypothetical protein|uniref:RAG2 PHD domain containing protein n=1 Tax=unclassified Methylobacterium TaxID=2615210 RepID=UPI0011CCC53D|nr:MULTISPECIES: RAG2 PHD domain containing protein [unclassified Methylobacterium]MCJ2041456.1 RAG2 PHD domain containing protein [Methylobacterium sp. J-059]MCJ2077524.1 RAG2 PHD domain containing protein [Methylobacterium sp. E-016]MCJ2107290.1 RAG2 PHD domain containing protein [Methylobacterium sp. E-041]TXM91239.1 RAG2 PHD domain containing protein [Methylobacterium sp. WL116]TXN41608.1 RAG2 PHD domain containing protein [Methylobacterium sp. WL93]